PVQYDDKGEIKKLSLLDLQEMRGLDPNVPGFQAKVSDLQPNQVVRVTLRQAKAAPADKPKEGDKAKPAPKMEVSMAGIVVADDLTQVKQDNKDAGKRKKKGK